MVNIDISTSIETIWETFRDRLSSEVTSVTIDDKGVPNSKIITIQSTWSTFPNQLIDTKSKYPILVVETPTITSQYHTAKRDELLGNITIDIYCTNAPSADKFMSQVYSAIETYKHTLSQAGIEQVHLESSDSDSAQRDGFMAHIRTLTFSFKAHFNKTW